MTDRDTVPPVPAGQGVAIELDEDIYAVLT